ncbi:MAG: alginate export family protein [Steroidobacteraceae bacterium]
MTAPKLGKGAVPAKGAARKGTQNAVPHRPSIKFNRWQEDWSVLADPALHTEPFDDLKYIPFGTGSPEDYASLGLTLRERFESADVAPFRIGNGATNGYLLQRLEVHLDLHPNENWQIFTQLQDDREFGKAVITPVDEDQLDLEQEFVAYSRRIGANEFRIRAGRQEMAFDLQRFVSVRDGPNVRQAFDALWLDWERGAWRVITFWSHPVEDRHVQTFDDYSSRHFQYGGVRVERQNVGAGKLSAYFTRYQLDDAQYLDAAGDERLNILDIRYAGTLGGVDWDLEGMGQRGSIGPKQARAWAVGTLTGYTFRTATLRPRVGLQVDAASGDRHPGGSTVGTFNPLFPNGYYFTLAGWSTYANLLHVKPSLTLHPTPALALLGALGFQWRLTSADAVYIVPNIPVPRTAGQPGLWTGAYAELRADWAISRNFAAALEADHFQVGSMIRRAGGRNANYLGIELRFAW